jgi:ribosome biogenesis GTPase
LKARIIKSAKREFDCQISQTREIISATALGNLLKDGQIVVGDYVELDDSNVIKSIYERENEVFRILRRENKKKITAQMSTA